MSLFILHTHYIKIWNIMCYTPALSTVPIKSWFFRWFAIICIFWFQHEDGFLIQVDGITINILFLLKLPSLKMVLYSVCSCKCSKAAKWMDDLEFKTKICSVESHLCPFRSEMIRRRNPLFSWQKRALLLEKNPSC